MDAGSTYATLSAALRSVGLALPPLRALNTRHRSPSVPLFAFPADARETHGDERDAECREDEHQARRHA